MPVLNNPAAYLFSGTNTQQTGSALDTRHCADYSHLWYQTSANSAVFNIEVSHDMTAWMVMATYTGLATVTGMDQLVGYYPYVRGNLTKVYSGTGGADNATGTVWVHYAPGLVV